jgi:hypothetical protein
MLTAAQHCVFFWESLANSWELFFQVPRNNIFEMSKKKMTSFHLGSLEFTLVA